MSQKIVINTTWGGFNLSGEGIHEFAKRTLSIDNLGIGLTAWDILRDDPILVALIEEDATLYGGKNAKLKVVEIPDDVEWYIHDYDGQETIHEIHSSWS